MVTYFDWKADKANQARLKAMADRICEDITTGRILSREALAKRADEARGLCAAIFPDHLPLFELVYKGRFERLFDQFGPWTSNS